MANNDSISSDLDNRLDEIFGGDNTEDDLFPPKKENKKTKQAKIDNEPNKAKTEGKVITQSSQLSNLQSILLSMDWEITDEVMNNFLAELTKLKTKFNNDKIIISFIQLYETVGKYINSKKANAHPDSMKIIHSIFAGFEKVVGSPKMNEAEKKKILIIEVKKLKELKEKIATHASTKVKSQNTDPDLLDSIKNIIKSEFTRLREELLREIKARR